MPNLMVKLLMKTLNQIFSTIETFKEIEKKCEILNYHQLDDNENATDRSDRP